MGKPYDPELAFQYNAVYGDYDRVLSYLYYDDLAQGALLEAQLLMEGMRQNWLFRGNMPEEALRPTLAPETVGPVWGGLNP